MDDLKKRQKFEHDSEIQNNQSLKKPYLDKEPDEYTSKTNRAIHEEELLKQQYEASMEQGKTQNIVVPTAPFVDQDLNADKRFRKLLGELLKNKSTIDDIINNISQLNNYRYGQAREYIILKFPLVKREFLKIFGFDPKPFTYSDFFAFIRELFKDVKAHFSVSKQPYGPFQPPGGPQPPNAPDERFTTTRQRYQPSLNENYSDMDEEENEAEPPTYSQSNIPYGPNRPNERSQQFGHTMRSLLDQMRNRENVNLQREREIEKVPQLTLQIPSTEDNTNYTGTMPIPKGKLMNKMKANYLRQTFNMREPWHEESKDDYLPEDLPVMRPSMPQVFTPHEQPILAPEIPQVFTPHSERSESIMENFIPADNRRKRRHKNEPLSLLPNTRGNHQTNDFFYGSQPEHYTPSSYEHGSRQGVPNLSIPQYAHTHRNPKVDNHSLPMLPPEGQQFFTPQSQIANRSPSHVNSSLPSSRHVHNTNNQLSKPSPLHPSANYAHGEFIEPSQFGINEYNNRDLMRLDAVDYIPGSHMGQTRNTLTQHYAKLLPNARIPYIPYNKNPVSNRLTMPPYFITPEIIMTGEDTLKRPFGPKLPIYNEPGNEALSNAANKKSPNLIQYGQSKTGKELAVNILSLQENPSRLTVRYLGTGQPVPGGGFGPITQALRNVIIDYLNTGNFNATDVNNLSHKDRVKLNDLNALTHISMNTGGHGLINIKGHPKRLTLIEAEIEAGNNNGQLLAEAKKILDEMVLGGTITHEASTKHLRQLRAFNRKKK